MYGVGNRLDKQPELLFLVRDVNHQELVSEAMAEGNLERELSEGKSKDQTLAGVDLGFDEPDGDEQDRPPPAPAEVRGIGLLLGEVLINLIDNAVRYAGRGATVTVRVHGQGSELLLEVEDNGPGVPESEREHLFERFVRGTGDGTGCGLGLAIVREIVERHSGSVELLPVQPNGLLARVKLPAAG